jgi:hypothetical protein
VSALTYSTLSTCFMCKDRERTAATEYVRKWAPAKNDLDSVKRLFGVDDAHRAPKEQRRRASNSEQRNIVTREGKITVRCCFHPLKDSDTK